MRERLGALLVGATGCAALIAAGPAFGATYCVHQGGTCAAGQVDELGDLQKALTDASGADSTVLVGPGTYTRSTGFSVSTSHALDLIGAGRGQTILKATSSGTVLSLSGSAARVSGMTLAVDSHAGIGLLLSAGTATDVEEAFDPSAPGGRGWRVRDQRRHDPRQHAARLHGLAERSRRRDRRRHGGHRPRRPERV